MAVSKEKMQAAYPLPAYNYKVTIDTDVLAFSEVGGLGVEYEKIIYKHGFSHVMGPNIILAQRKEINLTLKRGVGKKRSELYNWFTTKAVKDVWIDLCDHKGAAVVRWKISKAVPFKLETSDFDADGNDIAIESLDLAAIDLTIEYL